MYYVDFLIPKGLVELHGGAVGVISEEGHGSRFFVELSLFRKPASDEIALEEIYTSPSNITESMALVCSNMTAPDIETGDLAQQEKMEQPSTKSVN